MATKRVEVGWEHEGKDFRVVLSVGEAQPEIRWGANAQPGYDPDVEILEVREDAPGGALRPDLLELVEKDFDLLEEMALEKAQDDEDLARDRAEQLAVDLARDERRVGEAW